ncbi:MAG: aminotransferase class I/II-fold pyridoxal phosphate-dependent enzyme [bacterium]|nr:aminotransferase class I/II-fold pyridoxal phosphate-dependent enzyme [bacterium]
MKPSEVIHGGEAGRYFKDYGLEPRPYLDFSVNLSPLGPPPAMLRALPSVQVVDRYPERQGQPLIDYYQRRFGLLAERILPLNGSIEGIYLWAHKLRPQRPLVLDPGFGDYQAALAPFAQEIVHHSLVAPDFDLASLEAALPGCDACLVGSPHNPTGTALDAKQWASLLGRWPEVNFLVDQAFLGLSDDPQGLSLLDLAFPNLWVLLSLTKEFACPGLRLGALISPQDQAAFWLSELPPWRLSGPALAAVEALAEEADYLPNLQVNLNQSRQEVFRALSALPRCQPTPSRANFFWVRYGGDIDALLGAALQAGFFLRDGRSFLGLEDAAYFRLGLKTAAENRQLLEFLARYLA